MHKQLAPPFSAGAGCRSRPSWAESASAVFEGERRGGTLEAARIELLWDRAFATFWSTQLGIRHDSGEGKSRDWLAFGVQGLAPYWFETEATAYWRPGSGLAARLNARYEVLFTPRLILEPEVSVNLYSRADPERGNGSGLSDINAGLRLRYEVTRQLAPYVGVTWSKQFGKTADITRQRGETEARCRRWPAAASGSDETRTIRIAIRRVGQARDILEEATCQ